MMPEIKHTHTSRCAFTLIEVLLAALMMAIMLAALWTLYISAANLREKSHKAVSRREPVQRAYKLLRDDFDQMLSPGETFAGDFIGQRQDFIGVRRDSVEFYRNADSLEPDSKSVEWVRYALEEMENNRYALTRECVTQAMLSQEPEIEPQILLENVQSLFVEYYDGTAWQDDWNSTEKNDILPEAVSIKIVFEKPREGSEERAMLPLEMIVQTPYRRPAVSDENEEEDAT